MFNKEMEMKMDGFYGKKAARIGGTVLITAARIVVNFHRAGAMFAVQLCDAVEDTLDVLQNK